MTEKNPTSVKPPVSSRSRKKKRAKSDSMVNLSKSTGGLASRRKKSGGREMSEHNEKHTAHKQHDSGLADGYQQSAQQPERQGREEVRRLVHRHQRESRQPGDRFPGVRHQVGQGNSARSYLRGADRVRQEVRRALRQRRPFALASRVTALLLLFLAASKGESRWFPFPYGKGIRGRGLSSLAGLRVRARKSAAPCCRSNTFGVDSR